LLLVSPFVIRRVEQLSVTPSGLEIRFSRDVAGLGAPKAARILDRTDLAWFAQSYSFIHEELDAYREARTHLQDLLVERAAAIASREKNPSLARACGHVPEWYAAIWDGTPLSWNSPWTPTPDSHRHIPAWPARP
jgi:hypothetical protein